MATFAPIKKVGEYVIKADIDDTLGKTPKSIVFKGIHAPSGDEVAAKMFTWMKGFSTDMIDTQAQLMRDLPDHTNVLKLRDYIKKDVGENLQLWLVSTRCKFGDLKEFAQNTNFGVNEKLGLFVQSAKGVQHIHQHNIVHRDIKLQHILVHGETYWPVVKISGFGVARAIEREQTDMTPIGTNAYMAPELFKESRPRAGRAVDTFSLGLTFLAYFDAADGSSIKPFKVDDVPLGKYLLRNSDTKLTAMITKPSDSAAIRRIKGVIATMLAPTATDRPSMEQVVEQLTQMHRSL